MMLERIFDQVVCVERAGDGAATLIFLHGGGGGLSDWAAALREFQSGYRVVALDLPGHGSSSTPAVGSIEHLAQIGCEVKSRHGLSRNVLVAHSLGCWVALEMCRQDPSGIAGIVLIEGSRLAESPAQADALRNHLRTVGGKALLRRSYASMFLPDADAKRIAFYLDRVEALSDEYIEELLVSTVNWDATQMVQTLQSLRVPVLILQSTAPDGEFRRRPLLQVEQSPWIAFTRVHASNVEVEIIANAGHFAHVDQPRVVNAAIGRFAGRVLTGNFGL
jgi:pimeloyl-ACP methyl ester carboxylesterase